MTLLETPWVDQEIRDAIRNDLDVNVFVEAGAGTGKTKVVVDRIVHAVATGVVREASGLIAITFTEAAAAELRDRIRSELEKAAGDESGGATERERCATARATFDQ